MRELEQRPERSSLSIPGAVLSIGVGVVAVVLLFNVITWVAGAVFTVVKIALILGVVALAVRFFAWKRR